MRLVNDMRVKAPGRAAIFRFCRSAAGVAVLGLPLWLAACSHVPDAVNPVAWYRDISGNSKGDVKDQQGRNQNNLAAGGDKAYPNLATVPDEPDRVLSGIDRDKLQESLIADRNNAKYSSEQLEAGKAPSPGTASPAVASQPQTQADAAPAPAQQSAMVPPVAADQQAPSAAPTVPVQQSAALSPPSAKQTTQTNSPATQNRQNGSEQAPAESSLQTPEVRSLPQGETPPPPPAPANIPQPPAASAQAKSAAANPIQLTPPPAAGPQIQSSPTERPAQLSLALRSPSDAGKAMSVSVGDITFTTGSASLPPAHTGPLSDIAGLYKQAGGRVRVVGHAEEKAGGDPVQQQVASLDLALDRANAVAQALVVLGVPANAIAVEAAPTHGGSELPRAEVFMEY